MVAVFLRGPLGNAKELYCNECGRVFENWDDFDEHIKICHVVEANDRGMTQNSLKFYRKNKQWLGRLLSVKGKQGMAPDFFLEFENATIHFTGLNCGYYGEGPTGLAKILYKEGFFSNLKEAREYVASHRVVDLLRC